MHKLKIDVARKVHCLHESIFGIKEIMSFFQHHHHNHDPIDTPNDEKYGASGERMWNAKCSAFCYKILIETQFRMITSNFGMNYKENEQQQQQIASKFIFVRLVIYCRLFYAIEHGLRSMYSRWYTIRGSTFWWLNANGMMFNSPCKWQCFAAFVCTIRTATATATTTATAYANTRLLG